MMQQLEVKINGLDFSDVPIEHLQPIHRLDSTHGFGVRFYFAILGHEAESHLIQSYKQR